MKNLLTIALYFNVLIFTAQLPYSWLTGVNPGWTSTNVGSGGNLQWRAGCNSVTTNCSGNYLNNQNTTYTSFIIDASCTNATTLNISFFISGNAENGFDFLFCEYSIDGGTTWINPYGVGVGLTGNAGTGLNWNLPTIQSSGTFMFRFQFTSDPSIRSSGYRITNFQIACNVVLPIELLSFTGKNIKNLNYIEWQTASEINNDYFILERSSDGENWIEIDKQNGAGNSTSLLTYTYNDSFYTRGSYNFYRLTQVDFDGSRETFYPISINNEDDFKEIKSIKIYDFLGKEYISMEQPGLYINFIYYEDNTFDIIKIYKQ
jgi:hypothetical protein